jgi:hypothetical protein
MARRKKPATQPAIVINASKEDLAAAIFKAAGGVTTDDIRAAAKLLPQSDNPTDEEILKSMEAFVNRKR